MAKNASYSKSNTKFFYTNKYNKYSVRVITAQLMSVIKFIVISFNLPIK